MASTSLATKDEVDAPAAGAPNVTRGAGPWLGLVRNLGLLVLVLVAVASTSNLRSSWTSDDGVYAVQAKLLAEQGRWDLPQQHRSADPDRRFTPLAHTIVTDEGRAYPYVKQPLWIVAMAWSSRLAGGIVGLHLPAYSGAILAAAAAWALARRIAPGTEVAALWCVALGAVLIEATAMWAHTAAAALGGTLALVVARSAQKRLGWTALVVLAAACGISVLLRGEGLLAVVAVVIVLIGLAAVRARAGGESITPLLLAPAVASAAGLVAWLVNRAWTASILDGNPVEVRSDAPPPVGMLAGRVTGAMRTLVDGRGAVPGATLLGLAAASLAILAGIAIQRRAPTSVAVVLAGAAVGLVVARSVVAEGDGAGLLVAMPLLAVGVGAWRWATADLAERGLVSYIVINTALVLATQYAEGGGAEWGGRYLFFSLVPWTVVTLAALRRSTSPEDRPELRGRGGLAPGVALTVLALMMVPSLTGLLVTRRAAQVNDGQAARTASAQGETVILLDRFVGRWGWRDLPDADRLYAEPDDAGTLLERLRPRANGPITVLGTDAEDVRAGGYQREQVAPSEVVFWPVEEAAAKRKINDAPPSLRKSGADR